jgi:Domain of unknown function (DUF6484)
MTGHSSRAELLQDEMQTRMPGIVIGQLVGFDEEGLLPLVTFRGQPGQTAIEARTVTQLQREHPGSQVVLAFENNDLARPLILGAVLDEANSPQRDRLVPVEIEADGRRIVVTAKEQLELRCGKSSITLTRHGKVLIRGEYISSQATGVNRLKGGSVQIN